MFHKFSFQRRDQIASLLVNRALAPEMVVVFRHGQEPFSRNVFSAQHSFEEGNHLFSRLRASERNHQNSVVVPAQAHVKVHSKRFIQETLQNYLPILGANGDVQSSITSHDVLLIAKCRPSRIAGAGCQAFAEANEDA